MDTQLNKSLKKSQKFIIKKCSKIIKKLKKKRCVFRVFAWVDLYHKKSLIGSIDEWCYDIDKKSSKWKRSHENPFEKGEKVCWLYACLGKVEECEIDDITRYSVSVKVERDYEVAGVV